MSEPGPFDACVLGHVVLDRNVIDGAERRPQPGGAAYYAGVTYARLGLSVAVVTRVAAEDETLLLGELRSLGVRVINLGAPFSTVFRNIDSATAGTRRIQLVDREAPPIRPHELPEIQAAVWHLGPLRDDDLDPSLAAACKRRGGRVAIDVQGLTRRVEGGRVVPTAPETLPDLTPVDSLKADDSEILTLTGRDTVDEGARTALRAGAGEVVITEADRGSILFTDAGRTPIPAYPPKVEVDPTGCGDTYLAAYLTRRRGSDDPGECGRFAAAVAALKLEGTGPFRGDQAQVAAFRTSIEGTQT